MKTTRPDAEAKMKRTADSEDSQEKSTDFLVDEFGVSVPQAADLVAKDDAEAAELEEHGFEHERGEDALEDEPAPEDPHQPPGERIGHHMQKPVRHKDKGDPS